MVTRNTFKKKKKAPRSSRSADYLGAINAYGPEPTWKVGQVPTSSERARAMTWYSRRHITDKAEQFGWLLIWLEKKGHKDLMKLVKSLPEKKYVNKYLPRTACALARMEDLGAKVNADRFILKHIEESVVMLGRERNLGVVADEDDEGESHVQQDEEEETARISNVFKERIRARVGNVAAHLEDRLLDGLYVAFDVYEFLRANNYPVSMVSAVKDKLAPIAGDYEFAIKTGEGFGKTSKKILKEKRDYVLKAISDLERYASNEKKLKAPRKTKPVSVEKKLQNFRYLKESKTLNVASVNPADILGAKEMWFYDTRYNFLTVLRSEKGFDIQRTTITNFDPATSFTKKGGRRPDKWVERVLKDGRVGLKRLMDDVKKPALTRTRDRINDNTLLLRVVK